MTRATVRQEVRPLRFEALYERRQRRTLTMAEAAELLEITERTVRRWSVRYATEGAEGLQDRRRGRASARAVPVEEALRRVSGMRPGTPAGPSSMSTSVGTPSMAGTALIVGPRRPCRPGHGVLAPRRGAHRTKRPRKPLPGMMRHQDGSTHEWGPGCQWDLIVMVDDATTEISLAFFVEEVGTLSSFRGLQEVMERTGLFSSLYAGRGRTIGTPRGGGHGRYDPDDPGASRCFRPIHRTRGAGRNAPSAPYRTDCPQSSLAGITELAAANRYLPERFLPAYNPHGAVSAPKVGTAFIPWVGPPLAEILCVQDERVVANDTTRHNHRPRLQIPQAPHRFHDVTVTVRGHAYPDGTVAVFHGPRCVARYHADG